ncbi:MAG TPA: type 4a pilus biogenesis protein PilO [Bryobacteraceae bacterium]|jgi:Tfp pilus assembly protein PilO|nr:type 4a pilus biogenesis protein PilO [Bryobacteraceae bacterium]
MPRSFKLNLGLPDTAERGARFWLQTTAISLGVLNALALYLYLAPPGGTRAELTSESQRLQSAIIATKAQTARLKKISANVQLGSEQAREFEARYILPKRTAYEEILGEIQRMADEADITSRDASLVEEPIEGSDDLSVLTNQMNFEGSYENLMDFLYQVDHSPKMLILDTLTATPQKDGKITAQMRFQAIIREEPVPVTNVGQP